MANRKDKRVTETANLKDKDSIFSAVTEKIKHAGGKRSGTKIISNDKQFAIVFRGNSVNPSPENDILKRANGIEIVYVNEPCTVEIGYSSDDDLQRFIDTMLLPGAGAWKRIEHIAKVAQADRFICGTPGAVAFLGMIEAIASGAVRGYSEDEILSPLSELLKSEQAKRNAKSKNARPRAWVLDEWQNRPDQAQKKSEFAKQYAPLVKKKFDLIVNPDTIARDWLPKTQK